MLAQSPTVQSASLVHCWLVLLAEAALVADVTVVAGIVLVVKEEDWTTGITHAPTPACTTPI